MKSVFQVADQNRNGGICIREFNNVLRELEEKPSKDDEIFLVLEDLDDYLKEHFTQGSYIFFYPNLIQIEIKESFEKILIELSILRFTSI